MGKSFGGVTSLVPEAGLTKKESPVHAKKKINKECENSFKKNYVGLHLAQHISFARQRTVECSSIINKANERVNNTPK